MLPHGLCAHGSLHMMRSKASVMVRRKHLLVFMIRHIDIFTDLGQAHAKSAVSQYAWHFLVSQYMVPEAREVDRRGLT